jgi:hypothetical protein
MNTDLTEANEVNEGVKRQGHEWQDYGGIGDLRFQKPNNSRRLRKI